MPGQDRTGPAGQGPLTGRGLGPCTGGVERKFGFRCGYGRGFGRGFAWRARALQNLPIQPQVITETEEKQILEEELKVMKENMKEIETRLKELSTNKKSKSD